MDVDTIEPGADFVARIEDAVGSAAVLLVVVGRGWVSAKDEHGRRRLDDPEDFVRLEVASALQRDVKVIPVLVGGASMPESEELPAALAGFSRRNALVLSDLDWRAGMTRLLAVLEPPAERPTQPIRPAPHAPDSSPGVSSAATALALAGAALLVVGTGLQFDAFAHPGFGPADRDGLGYFTSLAPMGIAVGAVGSLLLSFSRGALALANGLVAGFALAGVARYVAVLGAVSSSPAEESSRFVGGALLVLGGCLLLAAAALWRSAGEPRDAGEDDVGLLPRGLVILGAALVVAGSMVPFNDGPGIAKQTLVERGWDAVEPIGIAVFALVASFLLATAGRRVLACGALLGLGTVAVLVWVRLLAIPALQPDSISSPGPGAFLGLAGAVAVLIGGLVAHSRLTKAGLPGGVPAGRAT